MSSNFEFGDWIFLLTSVFEMLFFCGFQTGWSSLVYVLVEEGIYSHLCVEDLVNIETANGSLHALPANATLNNCPAQQEMLNLAYTLATSVSAMAAFPLGIAIDHYGPRKVRVVAGIILGLSCLLLSYLTKSNPGLLFIGLFVACIANLMLYMTPQTCTNRFKNRRSLVIGLYAGAWVSSSLAFLCFKAFSMFGLNLCYTIFLYRRLSETQELKSGDETGQAVEEPKQHCQSSEEMQPCRSDDLQVWTAQTAESYLRSGLSYKYCALSTVHIWAEIFVSVCKLRTWFFVGTFSNFISELCGGDREIVAQYVNIFGLSHFGALLFAPLFGIIVDRQSRRGELEYVSPSSATEKTHQTFMMGIEDTTKAVEFIIKCNKNKIYKLNDAVLMTACGAALFCLLTLIPNLYVQIVTFQLYTFLRVSYNALFASVLIIIFPPNHLGKLMGLASFIGAVFSLVQYPLFIVMETCFGGRLLEVNVALWLLCMTTFGLPIYLWRKASSQEPHSLALVAV